MSQIITIEGNIGSGKSTLLEYLKEKYNATDNDNNEDNKEIIFLREPVDEWENIKDEDGVSILQKFYVDQKAYSFSFQMMAYISRLALLKEAVSKKPNAIIITERSLVTDKMIFAKMLYDSGDIQDIEYQIYSKWFECFANDYSINKVVYVNSSPEICYQRIHERSRLGESIIPLSYLTRCDDYHKNMIASFSENKNINVLELNGNTNIKIKENQHCLDEWIQKIHDFIYE
jgi:deoxyadenosine/deoxycytidine kinase